MASLDKYAFKLSAWLKTEATKSRKQRLTLKQMHIDLRALGFEGSSDRGAASAKQWKVDQLESANSASKLTFVTTPCFFNAGAKPIPSIGRPQGVINTILQLRTMVVRQIAGNATLHHLVRSTAQIGPELA